MSASSPPNEALAAVVLCAGKGTRMKSERAKVLHPLLGRPLAALPVGQALQVGAGRVVAVVGHQAAQVEAALKASFPGSALRFALQAEQKGTGHAVQCALPALEGFQGEVLILCGDVPLLTAGLLKRLLAAHTASGGPVSLVGFRPAVAGGYGRLVQEAGGRVARIVEAKDASEAERAIGLCNAGIYVASASFLRESLPRLTPQNAQGEYYLTDLVRFASEAGRPAAMVEAPESEVAGVNDRRELAKAEAALQAQVVERHQLAGVTFQMPASVRIEAGVKLGADVVIGPNVVLEGATEVGPGSVIEAGCVLQDAKLAEGVHLKPYTVIEKSEVGARCALGPFTRMRPETVLAADVHLGNFVETKKARIGAGSKAGHLAYLGDAEIGAGCNIGAGTITCNYDGKNKHRTELGDGVFIGSDSQLVAPVKVGTGAYVGAGTTVTKEVPPGALAISRAPQRNIEGWVSRKK